MPVVTLCPIEVLPAATPVTVTVCSVSQLLDVKVSADGDTVAVPAAPLATATRTVPPGSLFSRTAYALVPPPARTVTAVFDTARP